MFSRTMQFNKWRDCVLARSPRHQQGQLKQTTNWDLRQTKHETVSHNSNSNCNHLFPIKAKATTSSTPSNWSIQNFLQQRCPLFNNIKSFLTHILILCLRSLSLSGWHLVFNHDLQQLYFGSLCKCVFRFDFHRFCQYLSTYFHDISST